MQGRFNPNGASVTLSGAGTVDLTSTGQSFSQDVTVDPQAGSDQTEQSDYSWTCCTKQPRPKDCKKCPDLPKAPPCKYLFYHAFTPRMGPTLMEDGGDDSACRNFRGIEKGIICKEEFLLVYKATKQARGKEKSYDLAKDL